MNTGNRKMSLRMSEIYVPIIQGTPPGFPIELLQKVLHRTEAKCDVIIYVPQVFSLGYL